MSKSYYDELDRLVEPDLPMDIDEQIEKWGIEHQKKFKKLSEMEGVIIRGHIVIEQVLTETIRMVALNKSAFKEDRFTFSQKVIIANMLGIGLDYKQELSALNKLRNQIAHTLEIENKYVDAIIDMIAKKGNWKHYSKKQQLAWFKKAIGFIYGAVAMSGYQATVLNLLKSKKLMEKIEEENKRRALLRNRKTSN